MGFLTELRNFCAGGRLSCMWVLAFVCGRKDAGETVKLGGSDGESGRDDGTAAGSGTAILPESQQDSGKGLPLPLSCA